MLIKNAKEEFESYLARRGESTAMLTPEAGLEAMLGFYRDVRPADSDLRSDMLLAQWGTYRRGQGKNFIFDITRQLVSSPGEDENIWQLSLTFKFPPNDELASLGKGNQWWYSQENLEDFAQFIKHAPVYLRARSRSDNMVELNYHCAG